MRHEDYHILEAAFVEGFRAAADKRAFLQLAQVPHELDDGGFKLLEVRLDDRFTVGSASPGFASQELVYQPLPGEMVSRKTALGFVYVSAFETKELSFADILTLSRDNTSGDDGDLQGHHHQISAKL